MSKYCSGLLDPVSATGLGNALDGRSISFLNYAG